MVGCSASPYQRLYQNPDYGKRETLSSSLMKSEQSILTEEAIQKLLNSKIVIPNQSKLAILRFEDNSSSNDYASYYPSYWWGRSSYLRSSEYIRNSQEYLNKIRESLEKTNRFTEITILPKILITESPSLIRMRESAALMQANLLLIYKTDSFLATDIGIFSKNRINAYGSVEIVLVDIKTGVIPYTHIFDGLHEEIEISGDKDIQETERRAEKNATLKVLGKATEDLVKFLTPASEK